MKQRQYETPTLICVGSFRNNTAGMTFGNKLESVIGRTFW